MEAPRSRSARVERKGRFTITEISPNSPVAMSVPPLHAFADESPVSDVTAVTQLAAADDLDENVLSVAMDPVDTDTVALSKLASPQLQPEPMEIDEESTLAIAAAVPVALLLPPSQQQQLTPPEHEHVQKSASTDKVLCELSAPKPSESSSAALLTVAVPAVVPEPESSPVSAQQPASMPSLSPPSSMQRRASLVPGDSFTSVECALAAATLSYTQQPAPTVTIDGAVELQSLQQLPPPASPVGPTGLTIAVNAEPTDAVQMALDSNDDDTASAPSTPSPSLTQRESGTRSATNRTVDRRGKRKSRFTITDVSAESLSNELFAQNDPATSPELSPAYASQSPPSLLFASTDAVDDDDDGAAAVAPGVSRDFSVRSTSSVEYHLYQSQSRVLRPSTSSTSNNSEMAPPQRNATRAARSTPQKQRVRESRRLRMRSISPIRRSALQMSDLAGDSGTESFAEESTAAAAAAATRPSYARTGRAFFSGPTTMSAGDAMPTGASMRDAASLRRASVDESDGGYSSNASARRHHVSSSRHKSITLSAAQFLQQQQTIAALIRQQQELKHVIGVLQEQQQQLMSVPVQLHELRLENAKDDGKDETMRELYVQVDSLMRANDSLQELVTQAEREAQDRTQEAEFLTEENDKLLARCDYLERKYIAERKVTFVLEEEVQRFRMLSLTQELEQRSSVSYDLSP